MQRIFHLTRRRITVIIAISILLGTALGEVIPIFATTSTPPWTLNYPLPTSANYVVGKYSNSTYYLESADGQQYFAAPDASIIINDAIGNLTTGGTVELQGGVSFILTTAILFQQGWGDAESSPFTWTLKGNAGTNITQTTATDAIQVKNGTRVILKDFTITLGASAHHGIYGMDSGTDPLSFNGGGIQNIQIFEGNAAYSQIRLENFWYMNNFGWHLASGTVGQTNVELLVTTTATSNYGNSYFAQSNIYTPTNGNGIYMNGSRVGASDRLNNINTFDSMDLFSAGGTGAGFLLETNVYMNTFEGCNAENYANAINITGVDPRESRGNVFIGGYYQGSTNAINCGVSYNNHFIGLETNGNIVEATGYGGNTYQDFNIESGTVTSDAYGIFLGQASNSNFFTHSGKVTVGGGTSKVSVAHGLLSTPTVVLLTPSWATNTSYTSNATYVDVTFGTTTGGTLNYYFRYP